MVLCPLPSLGLHSQLLAHEERHYSVKMKYNEISSIINKNQTDFTILHESGNQAIYFIPLNTFNLTYKYADGHPNLPFEITAQTLAYLRKYCIRYDNNGQAKEYKQAEKALLGNSWDLICNSVNDAHFEASKTLVWNHRNELIAISIKGGPTLTFDYDTNDYRTSKIEADGISVHLSHLFAQKRAFQYKYIFVDGKRVVGKSVEGDVLCGPGRAMDPTGCQFFYHVDEATDSSWISDSRGTPIAYYSYLPTGTPWVTLFYSPGKDPTSPKGGMSFQFNDYQLDQSGFYWTGANYLDPVLGMSQSRT